MSIEGVLWFPPEFGTMSNRSERDFHLIYMCTVRQEVWPWPGNVYKFGIDTTIKNCHITEEDFPGKSGIDLSTTFAGLCVTSNAGGVMKDVVVQNNTCKDLKSRLWALSVRANAHGTGVSADSLSPRIIENTLDGCWQGLAIEAYHSNLFDAVVTGNRIIDAVDGFGFGGYLGIIAQGGLGGVLSNALLRHNDYSRSGIPPQSRSHNVWNCCLLLMECVNTVIDELGSWPNNKVGIGQWVTAKGGYGNHVVGGGTPAITNTTPLEKPVRVRRIR
jgi:hypothetical protein